MPGQGSYLAPPKTPASYRTIPLPQVVVDALAAFPAVPLEITDATHKPAPKARTAALIFTGGAGRPLRRTRFSDVWRSAAKAAELADGSTFHDLRHYYASLLIRHGESVKVVQKRLGHKSAVETLDTYSHLWPDSETGPARRSTPPLAAQPRPPTQRRRHERMCTDCARPERPDWVSAGQAGGAGGAGL